MSATEVDPAADLADLVDQSSVIVRGTVQAVTPGPSFPDTSDDGQVDPGRTSMVTVRVLDTLKGSPGTTVTVWFSGAYPADNLPGEQYLWFLKPSERPGVSYTSSLTGVIGQGEDGTLQTVRVPGDTSIIVPPSVDTVDELAARTEQLLGS